MILAFLAAYLCGSIPFGLLVGKCVKGVDIRRHGSGNIGTTNVFRVIGKKWGLFVFFLDALKGSFGVILGCAVAGQPLGSSASILFALTAILGHAFPVWLKFKGGKGVATSLGVFMAAAFPPTIAAFSVWVTFFVVTHIVSISSLAAAAVFPAASLIFVRFGICHPILIPISIALCAFIFYTHRENIKRLLKKEEKRLF